MLTNEEVTALVKIAARLMLSVQALEARIAELEAAATKEE